MKEEAKIFDKIVNERRSIRKYDQEVPYDKSIVERSLQRAMLAPNSSNMQLWQFVRVTSEEKKKELAHYCLDQLAATTARELVVFVARPDKYKQSIAHNLALVNAPDNFEKESRKERRRHYYGKMMPAFYAFDFLFLFSLIKKLYVALGGIKKPVVREVTAIDKKVTIHKSVGLAAQMFMMSVRAEGYDTCPMEGVDSKRIKKMLGLPKRAQINMVVSVGPRAEDGVFYPRIRYPYNEVVSEV